MSYGRIYSNGEQGDELRIYWDADETQAGATLAYADARDMYRLYTHRQYWERDEMDQIIEAREVVEAQKMAAEWWSGQHPPFVPEDCFAPEACDCWYCQTNGAEIDS